MSKEKRSLSQWLCLILMNKKHKDFTFLKGSHFEANTGRSQFLHKHSQVRTSQWSHSLV